MVNGGLRKDVIGGNLETQIACFLFCYRLTPYNIWHCSSRVTLEPHSHLDLLHLAVSKSVRDRQQKQNAGHDRHCHQHSFMEECLCEASLRLS